jgi:hypothetical protein
MKKNRSLMALASVLSIACSVLSPAFVSAAYSGTNGKIAYASATGVAISSSDGTGKILIPNTNSLSGHPRISPNGKLVVWTQYNGSAFTDYSNVMVAKTDGTGTATSITSGTTARNDGATWSPDGKWLAYAKDTTLDANFGGSIQVVSATGGTSSQLINAVPCTGSPTASDGWEEPSWSPDGNRIVAINRCDSINGGVYSWHVTTYTAGSSTAPTISNADLSTSTHVVANAAQKIYYWPSYKADMTKLIFVQTDNSGGATLPYQIMSATDTATATPTLLQGSLDYIAMAAWSPDGSTYAWQTTVTSGSNTYPQVLIGSAKVPNSEGATSADWGPAVSPTTTVSDDQSSTNYTVATGETLTVAATGKVGAVTVQSGGTIKGTGTAASVNVLAGGHVAPGNSPGCLNVGNTSFASGSFYDVDLGGTTPCSQYDQLKVTGTVDLGSATLNTTLYGGFVPAAGNTFTIVDNDAADAVTGTFNGLAEGATFTASGVTYKISYVGGDGNDVVITVQKVDAAAVAAAAAAAPAVAAPKAPNTGLALVAAHPMTTLAVTLMTSAGMIGLARRLKPVQQRK